MSVTKRSDKGSSLTYSEMDANFDAIAPRTSANGSIEIPRGTTAERDPSPLEGYLRFNTTTKTFEGFQGTAWAGIGSGGGGGAQGTQGFTGNTGIQGTDGAQGADGLQGFTGLQGNTGIQGTDGESIQGIIGIQGSTGMQGFTGIQGDTGAGTQGIQGTTGIQGDTGSQGTTGSGTQGVQGTQGDNGPQGIQGTDGSGSQGIQGTQGANGNDGIGSQGTQGVDGSQGTQGLQGELGSSGFGAQGVQGITGLQGLDGPGGTGAQGIQGPAGSVQGIQGPGGPEGQEGNQGTQGISGSASAVGVQGFQGPQGPFGPQGTTGAGTQGIQGMQGGLGIGVQGPAGTGAQGVQGITGSTGAQGIQGVLGNQGTTGTGVQGFTGEQGIQGPIGIQGLTGTAGDQGVQGNQGTTGDQGLQGNQGVQGVKGLQGDEGSQGTTGSQGVQGTQGTTGIQGDVGIQGNDGQIGPQGIQGIDAGGSQGIQGTTGFQGFTGTGADGTQGVQGITGLQGESASTGSQGAQGVQGLSGNVGAGTQGIQGLQGESIQGTTGTGIQGLQGVSGAGGGISNIIEDTTPQLGGHLDVNGYDITSASNGTIDIKPNGTGDVFIHTTKTGSTTAGMVGFRKSLPNNTETHDLGSHALYAYTDSTNAGTWASIALHPGTDTGPQVGSFSYIRATRKSNNTADFKISNNGLNNRWDTIFYGDDQDGNVKFPGTVQLKSMSDATRDALTVNSAGMIIWNSDDSRIQFYDGSNWKSADLVDDPTPTLGGNLDANDKVINDLRGLNIAYNTNAGGSYPYINFNQNDGSNAYQGNQELGRINFRGLDATDTFLATLASIKAYYEQYTPDRDSRMEFMVTNANSNRTVLTLNSLPSVGVEVEDGENLTLTAATTGVEFPDSSGSRSIRFKKTGTSQGIALTAPNISAARTIELPDASGTVALTSDISASGIASLVEDTSPQLGGTLDVNGQYFLANNNEDVLFHVGRTNSRFVVEWDSAYGALYDRELFKLDFTNWPEDLNNVDRGGIKVEVNPTNYVTEDGLYLTIESSSDNSPYNGAGLVIATTSTANASDNKSQLIFWNGRSISTNDYDEKRTTFSEIRWDGKPSYGSYGDSVNYGTIKMTSNQAGSVHPEGLLEIGVAMGSMFAKGSQFFDGQDNPDGGNYANTGYQLMRMGPIDNYDNALDINSSIFIRAHSSRNSGSNSHHIYFYDNGGGQEDQIDAVSNTVIYAARDGTSPNRGIRWYEGDHAVGYAYAGNNDATEYDKNSGGGDGFIYNSTSGNSPHATMYGGASSGEAYVKFQISPEFDTNWAGLGYSRWDTPQDILTIKAENVVSTVAVTLGSYSTSQRNALTGMAAGTMIWNSSNSRVEYYDGSNWRYFQSAAA